MDPNLYILFFEEGIACAEDFDGELHLISAPENTHFPLDLHREISAPSFKAALLQIRDSYRFDKNPIRIDRIPSVVLFSKNLNSEEQEEVIKVLRANKFRILFQSHEKELSSRFSTDKEYLMEGFQDMRKAHFERVEAWFYNSLDESAKDNFIFFDTWLAVTAKGLRAGISEERLREMVNDREYKIVEAEHLVRQMVLEKSEGGRLSVAARAEIREKLKRWNQREEILGRILNEEQVKVPESGRLNLNAEFLKRGGQTSGRRFINPRSDSKAGAFKNIFIIVLLLIVAGLGTWQAYVMLSDSEKPKEYISENNNSAEDKNFEVKDLEGLYIGQIYDHEFERYFYNTIAIRNLERGDDSAKQVFSFDYEILNKGRKGQSFTGQIDWPSQTTDFGHDPARAYRPGKFTFEENKGTIRMYSNSDPKMSLEKQKP